MNDNMENVSEPNSIINFGESKYHVLILREKLFKSREDHYISNIGLALRNCGYKVTIITSQFDKNNCLEEFDPVSGKINVVYSAWWIPRSFLGKFKRIMSLYKAIWMALRVVFFPPKPKPTVVILDINVIAIFFLRMLSRYKLIYIEHFSILKEADVYTSFVKYTPGLFTAKFIKYTDEIIVQSECLMEVFRRSFPKVHKEIKVFTPCVDLGSWKEETINIKRIIPDLTKHSKLFVVFGRYCKKSNFRLAIDAFELLMLSLDDEIGKIVHLVFAGKCSTIEEKLFYNELIEVVKEKPHADQITFLRQLPIIHKKTLIAKSTAVIHPTKYDPFPGPITAAMNIGRPVIATNTGLAPWILSHRISGILIEPKPEKFAAAMHKIMMRPTLQMFLSDMAKDTFRTHYSFNSFSRRMNSIILKYSSDIPETEIEKSKEIAKAW